MTGADDAAHSKKKLAAIWGDIAPLLRRSLGAEVFDSWFARLEPEHVQSGTLFMSVPTRFLRTWITENYRPVLMEHWSDRITEIQSIEITMRVPKARVAAPAASTAATGVVVTSARGSSVRSTSSAVAAASDRGANTPYQPADGFAAGPLDGGLASPLDPRFVIETFVVGRSNSLALAAAKQVIDARPDDAILFNPFYVHAAVGRGKTHLLQAMAAAIRGQESTRRVLYLTAERFMYRFVAALKSDSILAFKEELRATDILLIDDLQFLQGKTMQQEFCHILNSLIDGCRQVVVASDRPPADLDALDERVRSRLAGGLVVEIAAPDHDLRVAILRARAAVAKRNHPSFSMSTEVAEFIADKVRGNGRDLEGIFNRLLADNQFDAQPVTLDLAERTVRAHVRVEEPKRIRIEDIQKHTAQYFGVSKADLLSSRRNRSIVRPRQIAMYLSKMLTPRSLPEIGRRFGGRDHTTVLHAVRKIEQLMAEDKSIAHDVEAIRGGLTE